MKKILYLFFILTVFGCEESYLDLHSKTELSSASFWKTQDDVQLAMNGVYDVLQESILYGGSWFSTISLTSYDSFSDNQWNRIRIEGAGFYIRGTLDSSHGLFSKLWAASYDGIVRCNEVIANVNKMVEDEIIEESDASSYLGQAYFLRGLLYFNLGVYYENAPLILDVQVLENAFVTKNTQREILDQVIIDLELASNLLPQSYSDDLFGCATQGAANGLLARVYLFDKQWEKAADAAKKVIDSGIYNLDFPYEDQFTYDGETSKDVVFSVRFMEAAGFNTGEKSSMTGTNSPRWTHQPIANCVNDYYCIDGLPISESDLYNENDQKENRDPRLQASVYFPGDVFIEDLNIVFNTNDTGYGLKKYLRNKTTSSGSTTLDKGGQDFYVIRYADVLLMRAEALIESNKNLEEVYSLINEVRERVSMPQIQDVANEGPGLGQDDLRNILRHERRIELAFEGLRFFDLIRWGEVEEAYERMITDPSKFVDQKKILYQGKKSETFPIPLSELDANPNLTQNDAWK